MPHDIIIVPLLAGLSAGVYCIVYCLPFIAPVMITEGGGRRGGMRVISEFILGRFIGYVLFGGVAGYLGERFSGAYLDAVIMAALAVLSVLLIAHALGLWRSSRIGLCGAAKRHGAKMPVVMGFLMGVNVCPPFLLSVAYVFTLQSALKGVVYFLMFFLGTTVYFLPLVFLGRLGAVKEFQIAGRASEVIVGILFLGYSIYNMIGH